MTIDRYKNVSAVIGAAAATALVGLGIALSSVSTAEVPAGQESSSTTKSTPETTKATPEIKGPAPLPSEEEGLPG